MKEMLISSFKMPFCNNVEAKKTYDRSFLKLKKPLKTDVVSFGHQNQPIEASELINRSIQLEPSLSLPQIKELFTTNDSHKLVKGLNGLYQYVDKHPESVEDIYDFLNEHLYLNTYDDPKDKSRSDGFSSKIVRNVFGIVLKKVTDMNNCSLQNLNNALDLLESTNRPHTLIDGLNDLQNIVQERPEFATFALSQLSNLPILFETQDDELRTRVNEVMTSLSSIQQENTYPFNMIIDSNLIDDSDSDSDITIIDDMVNVRASESDDDESFEDLMPILHSLYPSNNTETILQGLNDLREYLCNNVNLIDPVIDELLNSIHLQHHPDENVVNRLNEVLQELQELQELDSA